MFYKLILTTSLADHDHGTWILQLPTTIGRNPDHGVCINHESISRSHCQLLLDSQGALHLRDLGSTNGTYVRDRKVKNCELFPGDTFQVGAVTFRIEYESDTDHGRPAPKPKTFDLSTTKPMKKLDKVIESPQNQNLADNKKWWQFWKE